MTWPPPPPPGYAMGPGYPGGPAYAVAAPFEAPAAAKTLRVLALVQAVAVLVGAGQAVALTVDVASQTTDDTVEGVFRGLGAFIGAVFALVALLVFALLLALLAGLRGRVPRRRSGVLISLAIVEVVLLVPATALAISAWSDPIYPDVAAVPTVVTLAGIAIIVLALVRSTRTWARGPVPPLVWTPTP